jgi:hypothetical protein
MRRLKSFGVVLGSFVAGVAFVIACGDDGGPVDAGRVDAANALCTDCEPKITADRVYQVEDRRTDTTALDQNASGRRSYAQCREGDVVLGGGCWVYTTVGNTTTSIGGGKRVPAAFGPLVKPPMGNDVEPASKQRYECLYPEVAGEPEIIVVATAICLDIQ